MIFTKDYNLRTSDFDRYVRLTPSSILDIFQDIAGDHASLLGCDYTKLAPRGLLWVVVKVRYEVLSTPALHQRVRVTTWPLKPTSLIYRREYLISSEDGTPLIKGTSDWVLVDSCTRSFATAKNIYPEDGVHVTEMLLDKRAPKIPPFDLEGTGYSYKTTYSDLDMNGHVNNTRYAAFFLDALEPDQSDEIRSLQMEFHKEIAPNGTVTIYTQRNDGEILGRGVDPEGETLFACRVLTK